MRAREKEINNSDQRKVMLFRQGKWWELEEDKERKQNLKIKIDKFILSFWKLFFKFSESFKEEFFNKYFMISEANSLVEFFSYSIYGLFTLIPRKSEGWRDGSAIKSTSCYMQWTQKQLPHSLSQSSIPPVTGNLKCYSELRRHHVCMLFRHRHSCKPS